MVADTIGDFLTRIRNAQLRKKKELTLPFSKVVNAIAQVLKNEGFIEGYDEGADEEGHRVIIVKLRYINDEPAIRGLRRISKPGVRTYKGYRDIRKVKGGLGINILTTPKGVITGQDAVKQKVGGELLCSVW